MEKQIRDRKCRINSASWLGERGDLKHGYLPFDKMITQGGRHGMLRMVSDRLIPPSPDLNTHTSTTNNK